MLNPELLKCYEDLTTLDTYVQQGKQWKINFIYVKTLTCLAIWGPGGGGGSIIRLGPYWFSYTLYLILILHVKYRSNLVRIC